VPLLVDLERARERQSIAVDIGTAEVEGGIQYTDVIDSDTSLQAFARYYFTETLSAALGLTFAGDTDGIGVSARYSF